MSQTNPPRSLLNDRSTIDCWVNYSTKNKSIVKSVMEELRKEPHSIQCWDFETIPGGRLWMRQIGAAMDRASKMLYFHSKHSLDSPVCELEYSMLFEDLNTDGMGTNCERKKLKIIPVRLDDSPMPREMRAIQYIDGRGKSGKNIACDVAHTIKNGKIPPQHVLNGTGYYTSLSGSCCKSVRLYNNVLPRWTRYYCRIQIEQEDENKIINALNEIPWLRDNYRFFGWIWFVILILLSMGTGAALGFTLGSLYTRVKEDDQRFLVQNSCYPVIVCSFITVVSVITHWFRGRQKEKKFLVSRLMELNEQINAKYNLLVYIEPDQSCCPRMHVYTFDFKLCKEEIHSHLAHVISGLSSEDSEDSSEARKMQAFLRKDNLLWKYLKGYNKYMSIKTTPIETKHRTSGWNCLCQFVKELHEQEWWD